MKRALLPLWFIGGIVCTTLVADAQSLEPASIRSDQAETHSVVVDVPRVHIAAACVSGSRPAYCALGSLRQVRFGT